MNRLVVLAVILCFAVFALPSSAQTVNLSFQWSTIGLGSNTVRSITLTPIARSIYTASTARLADPVVYSVAAHPEMTNGSITISNVLSGYAIKADIGTGWQVYSYTNLVGTNVSGTVSFFDYAGVVVATTAGIVNPFAYFAAQTGSATNIDNATGTNLTLTGSVTATGGNVVTNGAISTLLYSPVLFSSGSTSPQVTGAANTPSELDFRAFSTGPSLSATGAVTFTRATRLFNFSDPIVGSGSGLTNLNAVAQIIFTNAAPGFSYTNAAGLVVIGTNSVSSSGTFTYSVSQNTNIVQGAGYGNANANVAYTYVGGSPQFYTNTTTHFSLVEEDDIPGSGFTWVIVNSSNIPILGLDSGGPTGTSAHWYTATNVLGTSFSTIFATNMVGVPIASIFNPLTTNNFIYDAPNGGSDFSGLKGHPELPFQTFYASAAVSTTNDTIFIGPGVAVEGAGNLQLKPGIKVIGVGNSVSILTNGLHLNANNNCVFQNFTSDSINFTLSGVTNVLMYNLACYGQQDGIFITAGKYSMIAYNSTFASPWDAFADYSYSGGYSATLTNSTADFYNCNFLNDTNYPGVLSVNVSESVVLGLGHTRFFNCYISARNNAATFLAAVYAPKQALGTNGVAEFWNCTFNTVNSGAGASYSIYNEVGQSIYLHNCTIATNSIYDPSNKVVFVQNFPTVNAAFNGGSLSYTNGKYYWK